MDYCLGDGAGGASMWTGQPDVDVDADGDLDGVRLDFDGDGAFDDALADFDHDGLADHAVVNLDDDGAAVRYTDDGSGTWALTAAGTPIGPPRWLGLDGVEHPLVWARELDSGSRVVVDLLGHDHRSMTHLAHHELLRRSVAWLLDRDIVQDGEAAA